jgi:MYXO-CTERM domain-containing protein
MKCLVAMAKPGLAWRSRNAGRFGNPSRVSMSIVFSLATVVSTSGWAANICNETVPSNRIIDGIPAYQQCTDSTSATIYSNNGVDTATSSGGSDWVRTQGNGGYQCTELAHRYLYFKWGVKNVPNGNAGVWCDGTLPSGLEKTSSPVHGDLIVFAPGSCGADQTTGHVAVVDVVNTNATVTFIEQNRAGRRSCANDTAACFLHATANSGAAVDGGAVVPDSGSVTAPDASVRPDRPAENQRPDVLGTGGTGGTIGGQSGTGGTTTAAGTGGTGGATSPGTEPSATLSDGCSCRVGERAATSGFAIFLAFIAGTALLRRQRARRAALDGAPMSPGTK